MQLVVTGLASEHVKRLRPALAAAGHGLKTSPDLETALAVLDREAPPTGVLLGESAGGELVSAVRAVRLALGRQPAWLGACCDGEHAALAALGAGADDVVSGALSGPGLARRLVVAERIVSLKRQRLRLQYLVRHPLLGDPATGTLRPSALKLMLRQALARGQRTGEHTGLVLVELDESALPPEALIPRILAILGPRLRSGDAVARTDGGALMILLEAWEPEAMQAFAAQLPPLLQAGPGLGCATGLALSTEEASAEDLVDLAGERLTRAWLKTGVAAAAR